MSIQLGFISGTTIVFNINIEWYCILSKESKIYRWFLYAFRFY